MLFSCKISSSVLSFLENQGEDLSPLLEATPLPEEFLRDPSFWMQASEMEAFLSHALQISMKHFEGPLFQKIGHSGPELRSWGVFDSVLRMMPRPQEILAQPDRFLAYFISPAPPVDNVLRSETSISFDVPLSTDQYPLATAYLTASFESLPLFVGQPLASCRWDGIHLEVRWNSDQKNIFDGIDLGHSLSPDLMRNVVASLEKHSKDLEETNRHLQEKNDLLLAAKRNLEESLRSQGSFSNTVELRLSNGASVDSELLTPFGGKDELMNNVARLGDYMVRAQQLITLLVAQGRQTPQVKEAMRRVDWERVEKQFPQTIEECRKILNPILEDRNITAAKASGENTHV